MKTPMMVSADGLALIRQSEGCELVGYPDTGGVATIGWGTTGPHIYVGQKITQAQADDWLGRSVAQIENGLNTHTVTQLVQGQFDALADFAYEFGLGKLLGSTLYRDVQAAKLITAAYQFQFWVHGKDRNGVETVLEGMVKRRAAEAKMFLTGLAMP